MINFVNIKENYQYLPSYFNMKINIRFMLNDSELCEYQ